MEKHFASKKRKILKQFKINLLFAWMRAKIGHCVMNENIAYLLCECLQPLILQYLETYRKLAKYSFYANFTTNSGKFLRFQVSWYIDFKICICYNCRRRKEICKSMWTKRAKPSVLRILGASSCLFIVDKKPPGSVLSLLVAV